MSAWSEMKANLNASAKAYEAIAHNLFAIFQQAEQAQLLWARITPASSNVHEVSQAAGWVLETNAAIEHVAKGAKKAAGSIRAASASYP